MAKHPQIKPDDGSDELPLVLDMLDTLGQAIVVFELDETGQEVVCASNAAAGRLLGMPASVLKPGLRRVDLLVGLGAPDLSAFIRSSDTIHPDEAPFVCTTPSGRRVTIVSRRRTGGGSILVCSDVDQDAMEDAIDPGTQYRAVLESVPSGVLRVRPDGTADYANPSALSLFDVGFEDLDVAAQLVPSDGRLLAWHLAGSSRFEAEIAMPYLTRHLMVSVSEGLTTHGAETRILSLTDITPLKEARSRIEYLARHDPLTGLGNRTHLKTIWDAIEPRLGANGWAMHVIALDLDHFKQVNDLHGHAIGDALLRDVAARLRTAVGSKSHLFRFGGDEFLVLLDGPTRGEAIETAERIVRDLAIPFRISGHELKIGCSAGVASGPLDGVSREQIHRAADLALYEVKRHGRNGVACFDPAHEQALLDRRLLQTDLALAIANEDFHLVFQRQVEAKTDRTLGLEVILRWHNKQLNRLIPRAEFVPIAEQAGLVNLVDLWVIRNAIPQFARFIEAGWDRPHLAVNLSPLTLANEDIPVLLARTLNEHGIAGDCLEIEITEGVVIAETEKFGAILGRLRALGVKVAIDDFGAHQTSFGYLQSLQIERLKLDQTLVQRVETPDGTAAIVASIWDLCQRLGIEMTAEGVETADQWAALNAIGPIRGQGHFLGGPENAEAILERLGIERRRHAVVDRSGSR